MVPDQVKDGIMKRVYWGVREEVDFLGCEVMAALMKPVGEMST
jgi:hypothetical protein